MYESQLEQVADEACRLQRLTQIVTHLLGNALARTPSGGTVTLTAGLDDAM